MIKKLCEVVVLCPSKILRAYHDYPYFIQKLRLQDFEGLEASYLSKPCNLKYLKVIQIEPVRKTLLSKPVKQGNL